MLRRQPKLADRARALAAEWVRPVAVAVMVAVAVQVYREPEFIWLEPGRWIVLGALISLGLSIKRLPVLASLFYLLGAASMMWTLTPANTLLNSLWEMGYLAALVAGQNLVGFALLNTALLFVGLERTLLLDLFNLTQYFSGSVHYLAGAQALLFLPLCLSTAVRSARSPNRIVATLVAAACLLLILNSGARSVYLPALLVIPTTVLRLAWPRMQRLKAVAVPVVALGMVLALSAVLPGPTVVVPLSVKAVEANAEVLTRERSETATGVESMNTVAEEGGIGSRLKMWEQTLNIGLRNPLGTGAGSFQNTVHAFQEYPLIGFSSAHNVFLELFSTGGWPRLLVLVLLLAGTLLAGWNSPRWPVSVGAAGIWATMFFDITYQMPGIMMAAFWGLGASLGKSTPTPGGAQNVLRTGLAYAVLLVSLGGVAWWYAPCQGVECAGGRHLGYRAEVLRLAQLADVSETRWLAQRAVELNPKSLWAWRLLTEQVAEPGEMLVARRDLVQKFPLAAPDLYLDWAEAALAADRPGEARDAIRAGLVVFPPGFSPAGVPLGGRADSYIKWLDEARRILTSTESVQ